MLHQASVKRTPEPALVSYSLVKDHIANLLILAY